MSDDLVMRLRTSAGIDDVHDAADLIEAQTAEIIRLRAACDAYFKTISLSQIRHGRILVGLERRNARHRRALAKLYQRRHDKNAEIASLRAEITTARREGMKDAAKWHEVRSGELSGKIGLARNFRQLLRQSDFHMESAAAIRAAAKEDRPSEEIIREDRDAWPDHQANDPISAAAKEGK